MVCLSLSLQLKELRNRVADMEGQSRSSAGVSQLESKIQDLEERLRSEERYSATVDDIQDDIFFTQCGSCKFNISDVPVILILIGVNQG